MTRAGDRRLISWTNTCLLDEEGRVAYVVGTGLDVTATRRTEQKRRQAKRRSRRAVAVRRRGDGVPLPADERERLAALRSYGVLDTPPEEVYDDLVRLAAMVCETPIAAIRLVDGDR